LLYIFLSHLCIYSCCLFAVLLTMPHGTFQDNSHYIGHLDLAKPHKLPLLAAQDGVLCLHRAVSGAALAKRRSLEAQVLGKALGSAVRCAQQGECRRKEAEGMCMY